MSQKAKILVIVLCVGALGVGIWVWRPGSGEASPDLAPGQDTTTSGEEGSAPSPGSGTIRTVPYETKAKRSNLEPFPLEPAAGTEVRGRLVDSAGNPLAGVDVHVQIGRDGRATLRSARLEFKTYAVWRSGAVKSSPDGRISVSPLDPRGYHYLFVAAPKGFMDRVVMIGRPKSGEVEDLGDIMLFRPARVVGSVVDEAGAAVAGVMVRIGRSVTPGTGFMTSDDPMVQEADRVVFAL